MRFVLVFLIFFLLNNCSKPETVLICGDHACINKAEAEQYFQENLSIEVKVLDKNVKNEINLVELNLKKNQNGSKKISILSKKNTKKNLKILSNEEIINIKKNIKNKNKEKKIAKKIIKKEQIIINDKKIINKKKKKNFNSKADIKRSDIIDVCTILEKCTIDEISKYLLQQGRKGEFPDITTRQQ